MDWTEILQGAIDYIEDHLRETIKIEDVAQSQYVSSFHFQRIFAAVIGVTVGEYIRNRRLSLAGEELKNREIGITDLAERYGYDTAEGFTKAFTRFHGVTPSAVKREDTTLKFYDRLYIDVTFKGGFEENLTTQTQAERLEYRTRDFGPYRFIGKSLVGEGLSYEVLEAFRASEQQFLIDCLDGMAEYRSDLEGFGYLRVPLPKKGEKYLFGKVMKSATPVPKGLDYVDLPKCKAGGGAFRGNYPQAMRSVGWILSDDIARDGYYSPKKSFCLELFSNERPSQDESTILRVYRPCIKIKWRNCLMEKIKKRLQAARLKQAEQKVRIDNVYRQQVPALRFVGIKYGDADRIQGGFGVQWREWFAQGKFDPIDRKCVKAQFEDADASIGLMRWKDGEPFQYWIGKFVQADSPISQGYEYVDFPPSAFGIAWLTGNENELFGIEELAAEACREKGMEIIADQCGAYWFFERYASRYCQKDKDGNVTLDIGHFVG